MHRVMKRSTGLYSLSTHQWVNSVSGAASNTVIINSLFLHVCCFAGIFTFMFRKSIFKKHAADVSGTKGACLLYQEHLQVHGFKNVNGSACQSLETTASQISVVKFMSPLLQL